MAAGQHDGGPGGPERDGEDPLIGQLVAGRFRVEHVLARGGMGVVYAGSRESDGQPVAVKVLRPGEHWSIDPNGLERFSREAQSAGSIAHPHIVVVHEHGVLEDGRPFLVMERLVGETFLELGKRLGPLPPVQVAELVTPAASALDALHARGIVHRDVKPENLVVAVGPDGGGVVKLVDFGLVAIAHRERITRKGMIVGTPEFVAPECLVEDTLPDGRADVYSLAAVAFELLTGALPFDAPPLAPLLAAKLRGNVRTLEAAAGRPFPAALERAVAKGLSRKPVDRQATAGAFAAELAEAARVTRDPSGEQAVVQARASENVWSYAQESQAIARAEVSTALSLPMRAPARRTLTLVAIVAAVVLLLGCGACGVLGLAAGVLR